MREFVELQNRVAELERRLAGMVRRGPVEEIDPVAGTVRLKLGTDEDGKPYLSPPIPQAQMAGALKGHTPASKGQQMVAISEGGDPRQAVAVPMTWSDANANPGGTTEANVWTFGPWTISLAGDALKIAGPRLLLECGGSTFDLTGDGLKMVAPDYEFT